MTSPRSSLTQAGNEVHLAIRRAAEDGYVLKVDYLGLLDLVDRETGERTPISMVEMEK